MAYPIPGEAGQITARGAQIAEPVQDDLMHLAPDAGACHWRKRRQQVLPLPEPNS